MALTRKTDLTSLEAGDYVWAKYTAASGVLGSFTDIATDSINMGDKVVNDLTDGNATMPVPIVMNNELYITYQASIVGLQKIRVSKWNGTTWSRIDGGGINDGLNYDPTKAGYNPRIISLNNELYVTWYEGTVATGVYQVRVKKWNGTTWTFVDSGSTSGINFNTAHHGQYPDIISFNNKIYVTWIEQNTSSLWQVKVKEYDGTNWAFIDNGANTEAGLNYTTTRDANYPRIIVFNSILHVLFQERNFSANVQQIRVKKWVSDVSWTFIDGGGTTGINYNTGVHGYMPNACVSSGYLFVTWYEDNKIRVKRYITSWAWVDGGTATGINYLSTRYASMPFLANIRGELYAVWNEADSVNGAYYQIRIKKLSGSVWVLVDGGFAEGISSLPLGVTQSSYPTIINFNNELSLFWTELDLDGVYRVYTKSTTNTGQWMTEIRNDTATPSGYFRFICVGEDYLGRKRLIADRNIQSTYSYQRMSEDGLTNENGFLLENTVGAMKELLPTPSIVPTGTSESCAYASNGIHVAISSQASPYVLIYKRDGDTFTKLPNPATLPAGIAYGVAFSPDSMYLTVCHQVSPYITIYKRDGDTFTKLDNPSTLPTGLARRVSFSPDGVYMGVVHDVSPLITIYKRTDDVFTKLTNPVTLPTGATNNLGFSPDSKFLTVCHNNTPFFTIYKVVNDVFTKLANPTTLPTGYGVSVGWSPNNNHMVISSTGGSYMFVYKRDGDTFTNITTPFDTTPYNSYSISFTEDSRYMYTSNNITTNVMYIYKRKGDKYIRILTPTMPTGTPNNALCISLSPDSKYMCLVTDTTPFVHMYKTPKLHNDPNTSVSLSVRLFTGGLSATDTNNEWYKYLLNSRLNNKLISSVDRQLLWNTTNLCNSGYLTICSNIGVARANAYNGTFSQLTANTTGGFRPMLIVDMLYANKYLVQDGNDLYKVVNGTKTLVGTIPATKALFISDGMDNLNTVTNTVINSLSTASPKVLTCTLGDVMSSNTARVKYTPNPQLILASGDLDVYYANNIDSVTIASTVTGGGNLRIITSVDGGATWKAWSGTEWATIDISVIANVATNGMTPATINSVTGADWTTLLGQSSNIRFGYYLEQSISTDNAKTDSISIQLDMRGSWDVGIPGVTYNYNYPTNDRLRVILLQDGSYKINY